jgi:tetraacyldisaccharide 4'-kinase
VPLDEPSWWYTREPTRLAVALRPLAAVYGRLVIGRFARASVQRARVPVICVGNFTAGGSGKTPVVMAIARLLGRLGQRPAILMRGYGGSLAGPAWVEAERHTAREVGDEALLLAGVAPTLVSRDRARGADAITRDARAPTAIVMDDGMQNPRLAKSLTIAVVDAQRGVGNGEVIPAGPLRAPLEFQLELINAVVVAHPPGVPIDPDRGVHGWLRQRFQGPVIASATEPQGDLAWLQGARVVAYAGIANPQRFFALAASLGGEVVRAITFKDHHAFSEADAARLIGEARSADAELVTTEKDIARLDDRQGRIAQLRASSRAIAIAATFAPDELARLEALISAALVTAAAD